MPGVGGPALRRESRSRLSGRAAPVGPRRVGAHGDSGSEGARGLDASFQSPDVERAPPLLPGTARHRRAGLASWFPRLPLGTAHGSDPTPCASSRSGRPEASQPRRQGPRRPGELTRTAHPSLDFLGPRVPELSPSPSPEAVAERRAQRGADPKTRRRRGAHQPRPRLPGVRRPCFLRGPGFSASLNSGFRLLHPRRDLCSDVTSLALPSSRVFSCFSQGHCPLVLSLPQCPSFQLSQTPASSLLPTDSPFPPHLCPLPPRFLPRLPIRAWALFAVIQPSPSLLSLAFAVLTLPLFIGTTPDPCSLGTAQAGLQDSPSSL